MELKLNSPPHFEQQLLSRLLESWKLFVNQLPVQFDAASSIPLLEDFGTSKFSDFKIYGEILLKNTEFRKSSEFEEGMNSPGILWDRLTILNCKLLFTAADSIHHKPELHLNLGNVLSEIKSVSNALSKSLTAKHIIFAK